ATGGAPARPSRNRAGPTRRAARLPTTPEPRHYKRSSILDACAQASPPCTLSQLVPERAVGPSLARGDLFGDGRRHLVGGGGAAQIGRADAPFGRHGFQGGQHAP